MSSNAITFDFDDGNGPVPAHQHANGGGWVNAQVYDHAEISDSAQLYGNSRVFGRAKVYGNEEV